MSVSLAIRQRIDQFKPGKVFGYSDFPLYKKEPAATVKAVERVFKDGQIRRLSKGCFYKPKKGIFGELKPSDSEILRSILYRGGQLRGYVTGIALFNQLGLTTQLPRTITIAVEGGSQEKDFGTMRAKLIRSRAPIKAADVKLLQYLDVLKDISKIPDADTNESVSIMAKKFSELNDREVKRLKNLATKYYTAKVIALTGFLFDFTKKDNSQNLKEWINPLTKFKIGLNAKQWPQSRAWNIQ